MSGSRNLSIFAALLLITAPPSAEAAPVAADADPIVVTGEHLTPDEARARALEFVRRTGVADQRPIARWIAPVCPRVIGVDETVAAIVEKRVRAAATAAGAREASARCTTNIAIVFTDDGGGLARTMQRKSPQRFSELSPTARDRALHGGDAIRWWYTTRVQSRDGASASGAPMPWAGGNTEGGSSFIGGGLTQYGSSLVSTQAVRALSSATVVIDVEKANGYPLDAIASFAAMVAMAELDSDPPAPDGSILGLFEGGDGQRGLSGQDSALLRAIYSIPPDREAYQHRRELVTAMSKGDE